MASWNKAFAGLMIGLAVLLMSLPRTVRGQDFRVDTEMFQNQKKEPFLQTLTIFANGVIYDFRLTEPLEASVFDPRHGRFTLLDESRKAKATVTTQELLKFCFDLETHAAQEKNGLFAFCAAPQFETTEKEIERNGQGFIELRLTAKPLAYVAVGQRPEQLDAVKSYRQFADWFARLNATCHGNLPARARLELNQSLAERDLLPFEITRTTSSALPFEKKLELKSQHRVNWSLSGEDRKKIERAADMMATFQAISYDEYRSAPTELADTKQVRR